MTLPSTFAAHCIFKQKYYGTLSFMEALKNVNDVTTLQAELKNLEQAGRFEQKKTSAEAFKEFKAVLESKWLNVFEVPANTVENNSGELDKPIFKWHATEGVEIDIPEVAKQTEAVHLFSVASQYNCAEAPSPFTPPVGEAMLTSEQDGTQGPLAQRTNPCIFELVNALLANLGFNMMEEVLPSAGSTCEMGASIEHGYLRPTDKSLQTLAQEMQTNYQKYKTVCYESKIDDCQSSVFLILGAAPAIDYSSLTNKSSETSKNLQYYAYLANFSAQFNMVNQLLIDHSSKKVILHVTGVGLGVFGCDTEPFANAFKRAAVAFQTSLSGEDKKRVEVQLDSYQGTDKLKTVADNLALEQK